MRNKNDEMTYFMEKIILFIESFTVGLSADSIKQTIFILCFRPFLEILPDITRCRSYEVFLPQLYTYSSRIGPSKIQAPPTDPQRIPLTV